MTIQAQKAIIVFGVSGLLFWLYHRNTNNRKPNKKEATPAQQKSNATTVANAYGKAMKAGETPANLEELNKLSEQKYGLRVYKKPADGKFYVIDTKGNEVLKIT